MTIIRTQTSQIKSVLLTEKSLSVDLGDEDFSTYVRKRTKKCVFVLPVLYDCLINLIIFKYFVFNFS